MGSTCFHSSNWSLRRDIADGIVTEGTRERVRGLEVWRVGPKSEVLQSLAFTETCKPFGKVRRGTALRTAVSEGVMYRLVLTSFPMIIFLSCTKFQLYQSVGSNTHVPCVPKI